MAISKADFRTNLFCRITVFLHCDFHQLLPRSYLSPSRAPKRGAQAEHQESDRFACPSLNETLQMSLEYLPLFLFLPPRSPCETSCGLGTRRVYGTLRHDEEIYVTQDAIVNAKFMFYARDEIEGKWAAERHSSCGIHIFSMRNAPILYHVSIMLINVLRLSSTSF
jgi:hypothetical protein